MKNSIVTTLVLALLLSFGCGDVPPEPEVTSPSWTAESPTPMADQTAPEPVPDTTPPPYQPPATSAEPQTPRGPVMTQARPQSPDDIERITIPDFQRLQAAGEAVIVDVRSRVAFVQAHIPGSISIPAPELAQSLHMLPRDKKIVTYCT
jgi:hypothetical protein